MVQDPSSAAQAKAKEAARMLQSAKPRWIFGSLDQWKCEQAASTYVEAGNLFKMIPTKTMAGDYEHAGEMYKLAAEIQRDMVGDANGAARTLVEAFNVYRQFDIEEASRCLNMAAGQYTLNGNLRAAATQKGEEGDMFATAAANMANNGMIEPARKMNQRALKSYEDATEWADKDFKSPSISKKNRLKAGDLAALLGDYYKAIEIFEKLAASYLADPLTAFSAKDAFLKAGICHLATNDMIAFDRAVDQYCQMRHDFEGQPQHKFLIDLAQAVRDQNKDEFGFRAGEYDRMRRLDPWFTEILNRVKSTIQGGGPIEEEESGEFD